MIQQVAAERRAQGGSVLLVSHVLSEVALICDRVAVLVAGQLAFLGKTNQLTRDAATGNPQPLEKALQKIYDGSPKNR